MVEKGAVILITGAGSGMGREVARQLGRRGCRIGALDKKAEGLESLHQEFAKHGQVCQWREADVTDSEGLRARAAELEGCLGPVDVLIACAGKADETPAQSMDPRKIEQIVRINLLGVSNSIAAVLPGMLARRRGHVAAISSLAAFHALPSEMAYCASKAGLNALMDCLRLDVRDQGIQVTTICPGWTRTAQTKGQFKDADLMKVEDAAREILKAIDRRARLHLFPWWVVWQLRLMNLCPAWLQDRLVLWRIRKVRKDK
jgi:short-subunit dehydrogenase